MERLFNVPVGAPAWTTQAAGLFYMNEMGVQLHLDQVEITYVHDIDMSRPVAELMYDDAVTAMDENLPSVLIRGLNAFFTHHVMRSTGNVVTTGGHRSFEQTRGYILGPRSHQSYHIRALKGSSLSTRPGNDQLFLNVNTATSPFFSDMTVADFIHGARQSRRPGRESKQC